MTRLQIFSALPPRFSRIQDAPAAHSAASGHTVSNAFSGLRDFTVQFGRGRVHGGAAIQTERILNLADIPIFGKKYPSMRFAIPSP
jgi:hypothetical protein